MPRKKQQSEENNIQIKDSSIPWSFIWKVYGQARKDWDVVADVFWKARNCEGKNGVQRYIMVGLRSENKWILQPSKEKENGKMESIRQWWLGLYERKKSTSKECADMIAALTSKFDMGGIFGNTNR